MSIPRTEAIALPRASARATGTTQLLTRALPELVIGVLGLVTGLVGITVPSVWYDEAATITSATRSWSALWTELHHVDAVHGLYYAGMHIWFAAVGYSPFTLRLPSALAVGVAAALVVALGRRIGDRELGLLAGVIFVALPRTQWAAGEGRPYALITVLAVALTLVVTVAVGRRGAPAAGWWAAYSLLAALSIAVNLFLGLIVLAHGVGLVWQRSASRRRGRVRDDLHAGVLGAWFVATCGAIVAASPIAVSALRQSSQIGWIPGFSAQTLIQVFQTAWFGDWTVIAVLAWPLLALGSRAALRAQHAANAPENADACATQPRWTAHPRIAPGPLLITASALPGLALVTATALGHDIWTPKYATLSAPFVAILIALGLRQLAARERTATGTGRSDLVRASGRSPLLRLRRAIAGRPFTAALGALLVLCIGPTVFARLPTAKDGADWAAAAAIIQHQRWLDPDPNEGIIYGQLAGHSSATSSALAVAYPHAFAGLRDLLTARTGPERGQLWARNASLATTLPSRLQRIGTVWFVGASGAALVSRTDNELTHDGFGIVGRWFAGNEQVVEYRRLSTG